MKNLLIPILLLTLSVGFGCKSLFQQKSVIGKWKAVKVYENGKWGVAKDNEYIMEFLQDGRYSDNVLTKLEDGSTYKVDNSVNPNQLLLIHKGDKQPIVCIYKFQGEKLILKAPNSSKYGAPKDFSTEPNFGIIEFEKK